MSLLQAAIIAIAAIYVVGAFSISTSSNAAYNAHRRLLDGNSAAKPASLNNCDRPPEWIVPDEYIVYLHRGYSLEDHQRTVGEALPICTIESVSRIDQSAVYYVAKLDRRSLDAIRSDPGVDFVECDGYKRAN
jgi:hypothetical protein